MGVSPEVSARQLDPLAVERLLQARTEPDGQHTCRPPQDATLAEAVARMTTTARAAGLAGLVMSAAEWEALVLRHMGQADVTAFTKAVVDRAGNVKRTDDLYRWLQLAMNIWNATPQPDRAGKTAYELTRREGDRGVGAT